MSLRSQLNLPSPSHDNAELDRAKAALDMHQLPATSWVRCAVADLRTGAAVPTGRTTIGGGRDRSQGMALGRSSSLRLL